MLNPDSHKSDRKIKSPFSPEQIVYNILRDTLASTQKNLVNNSTLSQEVMTILTQDLKKALRLDQNSGSKYFSSDSLYKNVEKIAKDLKQTLEKTPSPSQNIRQTLQDIIAKHNKPTISSHRR